uniref:Resistance to inhibitors of cholinesterase protein 3 N-terminal domain-containing protein n=1 Tax=Sinocyclocheilus anshuiensis TaxID=1608454 RepID=A0A671NHX7_9TELE
MAVSTCQKITFISCIVLCMSLFLPKLFLPRVKKETVQSEGKMRQKCNPSFSVSHYNPEAIARAKGVGKPNLLGQVIPVYGFGIFLYIIYLFFKVSLIRSYLESCSVRQNTHLKRCVSSHIHQP